MRNGRWAILDDGRLGGHENMARDLTLLRRAEANRESVARLYEWDGPWVSLGRFQHPAIDLLDPSLVPWVVRPTGGKAVLHGHDLTVALAAPLESFTQARHLAADLRQACGTDVPATLHQVSPLMIATRCEPARPALKTVYRALVAPLIGALRALGLNVQLAENTPFVTRNVDSADCFCHMSPNDVIEAATGRKLVGCAMRVTRKAALAQCSIPVSTPLVDPADLYEEAHVAQPLPARLSDLRERIVESLAKRTA